MNISTSVRTIILIVAVAIGICVAPGLALADGEYDQGYEAGKQAALERITGVETSTGPLALLKSYFVNHEAKALKCVDAGKCEEYKQGFVCGFCEAMTAKQRECFKTMGNCSRVSATGRQWR